MGLLDDAIREHLELKRQHGADPDEVSRQEREALGAARRAEFAKTAEGEAQDPVDAGDEREPFDVDAPSPAAPEAQSRPDAIEPAPEPQSGPDAIEPAPEAQSGPDAIEPAPEAQSGPDAIEPPPEPDVAKPGYDEDPWEPDEVPAGEALDHPRTEEHETGAATDPEPRRAVDPETGEDVLEETPDFLQETPEHDRLWFEQRPPRDFDWDK
jgi:hypothetical protein